MLKSNYYLIILLIFFQSCIIENSSKHFITVLGTVQDAGYPQIGCLKDCCNKLFNKKNNNYVTSIGLSDIQSNKRFLFEATPDIAAQIKTINNNFINDNIIDGIFLTHAHIGHYSGLMYLGREAYGGLGVPVFVMPRMLNFLSTNGPWDQLVSLKNIELNPIEDNQSIKLTNKLTVIPFIVPHRDEFSETVGYKIIGPEKSALFIPDINKWELWDKDIIEEVRSVDYAFLDATFFEDGEIERPMDEIPHPFVKETIGLFENESKTVKNKIYFIHFNHTNISLQENNSAVDSIVKLGYNFARFGDQLSL